MLRSSVTLFLALCALICYIQCSIYNPENLNIDTLPTQTTDEREFFRNVLNVAQNQTSRIATFDVLDTALGALNARLPNETCWSSCFRAREAFRNDALEIYVNHGQDNARLFEESLLFVKLFAKPNQLLQTTVRNATQFISSRLCETNLTLSTNAQENLVQSLKLLMAVSATSDSVLREQSRQAVGTAFNCFITRVLGAYPSADYKYETANSFSLTLKRFNDVSSIRNTFVSLSEGVAVSIPDSIPSSARSVLVWRSPVNPHTQGGESRAHVSIQFYDADGKALVLTNLEKNIELTFQGDFIQWDYAAGNGRRPTENRCAYWSTSSWHSNSDCQVKKESTSSLTCECSRSGEFAVFERDVEDDSWIWILSLSLSLGIVAVAVLGVILLSYFVYNLHRQQEEIQKRDVQSSDPNPSFGDRFMAVVRMLSQQLWLKLEPIWGTFYHLFVEGIGGFISSLIESIGERLSRFCSFEWLPRRLRRSSRERGLRV